MLYCPECGGEIEDYGDFLECTDCCEAFDPDSTEDDYEPYAAEGDDY